jgi:hypothetical protein
MPTVWFDSNMPSNKITQIHHVNEIWHQNETAGRVSHYKEDDFESFSTETNCNREYRKIESKIIRRPQFQNGLGE